MDEPYSTRFRRLREQLTAEHVDGVVLFPSENLYYLTGFWEAPMERHLLCFVPQVDDPVFVAPELYRAQLVEESAVGDVRTYADGEDPVALIESVGRELDIADGTLLVDTKMWALFTQDLRRAFPNASFGLADDVLDPLRMRKDDAERSRLREASRLADSVMETIRDRGAELVGSTEAELAAWIAEELSAVGEELSFEPVVGSGPNGAKPHHRHGDRTITEGDPVVFDFGVRYEHYPSDMTRTLVLAGEPPSTFLDVFETVREAQERAVEAVQPGVTAASVDDAARSVIEAAGYGEQFIHRTGHGVGLDVHEAPYIVSDNEQVLEPGMVFSVEPGIYLEDQFGIRIEDLVLVTEDGAERLNRVDRDWRVG